MRLLKSKHNPEIHTLQFTEEDFPDKNISEMFDVFDLIYCLKWQLIVDWHIYGKNGDDWGIIKGFSKVRVDLEKHREQYGIALDESKMYALAQMPDYENVAMYDEMEIKCYSVVSYPFTLDYVYGRDL